MKKLNIFHYINGQMWSAAFLAAGIYFLSRLVLLVVFKGDLQISAVIPDVLRALGIGFLFDLKVVAAWFIPLFILALLGLFLPEGFLNTISKGSRVWSLIIVVAFAVAGTLGFFYYRTYQQPVDIVVFGFIDDDRKAIFETVFKEYPVFRGFLFWGFLTFLFYKLIFRKKHQLRFNIHSRALHACLVLVWVLGFAFALRGSFGKFPLRRGFSVVSTNHLLNSIVPNSMIGLLWAYQDRQLMEHFDQVTLDEGRELYQRLRPDKTLAPDWIRQDLMLKTPTNAFLEAHPPHVVFALMESQTGFFLKYHNTRTNNLLGALEPHVHSDFFFKNFLSFGDGTFPTLVRLLLQSPFENLQNSQAQKVSFYSSFAHAYKAKGYKTIFVSSGNLAWRQLGSFLKYQSFDELIDYNSMAADLSDAEMGPWGIADHHSFAKALEILQKNDAEHIPTFVFILTTTNHPPYGVPRSHQPLPIEVPAELPALLHKTAEESRLVLSSYQYANNALGEFISAVKTSKLGPHTIIGASGDHYLRDLDFSRDEQIFYKHNVPFYMYVPPKYLAAIPYTYNASRLGSHRDIMPTFYHVSLSNADYLNLGQNILAPENGGPFNYAFNNLLVADKDGAYILRKRHIFLAWDSYENLLLHPAAKIATPTQQANYKRYQSYEGFLRWLTLWQYQNDGKIMVPSS